MNKSNSIEVLNYADHIMILKKGYNKEILQKSLDELNQRITDLNLKINPGKCSCMVIRYMIPGNQLDLEYIINGTAIKQVKSMNILGVHINTLLRLDRQDTKIKIRNAIKRLCDINDYNIIHQSKQWKTLLDSILMSHLNVNNWPILANDIKSRKCIDKETMRAVKVIFNWPPNISNKVLRLILQLRPIDKFIEKSIKLNTQTEHSGSYRALEKLFDHSGKGYKAPIVHKSLPTSRHLSRMRRYHNPEKTYHASETLNIDEETLINYGPFWIAIDRRECSLMGEIFGRKLLQIKAGRHTSYQIAYFNTFALMWEMTKDKSILNRKIVMHDKDALYQALINLRETMIQHGWRIYTTTKELVNSIRLNIEDVFRECRKAKTHHAENFDAWTSAMECYVNRQEMDTGEAHITEKTIKRKQSDNHCFFNERNTAEWLNKEVVVWSINEPSLVDYLNRHKINLIDNREAKMDYRRF